MEVADHLTLAAEGSGAAPGVKGARAGRGAGVSAARCRITVKRTPPPLGARVWARARIRRAPRPAIARRARGPEHDAAATLYTAAAGRLTIASWPSPRRSAT
jgi:hypothetical protein